jgi:hypothetical protein
MTDTSAPTVRVTPQRRRRPFRQTVHRLALLHQHLDKVCLAVL